MAAIGAIAGIAGTAISAMGQMAGGKAAREASERQAMLDRILGQREAESLRIEANTVQASGQQNALQKSLQLIQVQGQARAAAGASGGGADDTSVLNTQSVIGHVGEFQKGMDVFAGENRARGLRYQATLAEIGGENKARATLFEGEMAEANARGAASRTLLGGFGGLFTRFGGGGVNRVGGGVASISGCVSKWPFHIIQRRATMPPKGSRATKPNRKMAPLRVTAVPEKRKRGHPTIKTPELLEELCRRIASGRSIISLSHDEDMPDAKTIYRRRQEDSSFNHMIAFAREERKEITRDRLLQLATDVLPVEGLAVDRVNAAAHCLSKAEAVMQPRQKIEMAGSVKLEDDPPDLAMLARKVALAFRLMAEANEPKAIGPSTSSEAGDGED